MMHRQQNVLHYHPSFEASCQELYLMAINNANINIPLDQNSVILVAARYFVLQMVVRVIQLVDLLLMELGVPTASGVSEVNV